MLKKGVGTWRQRRRDRQAEQDAARQRLHDEYQEKPTARDPDVLEASRDWADNDGSPSRVEVYLTLGLLVLVVSVAVLTVFFMGIEALTGR